MKDILAKNYRYIVRDDSVSKTVSLKEHTEHVYKIAELLLKSYNDNFIKDVVLISAIFHDIGKIDPVMQEIIRNGKIHNEKIDHALISYLLIDKNKFLDFAINNLKYPEDLAYTLYGAISRAVVFHHFRPSYLTTRKQSFLRLVDRNNDKNIIHSIENLKEHMQDLTKNTSRFKELLEKTLVSNADDLRQIIEALPGVSRMIFSSRGELNIYYSMYDMVEYTYYREQIGQNHTLKKEYIVPLGILMRSDALASYIESENVYMNKDVNDIQRFLEDIQSATVKISDKVNSMNIKLPNNNWQKEIIEKWIGPIMREKLKNKVRGIILIAPTGSGKSEFAFYLAKELNVDRIIYTLPIRTAIESLYERFREKYGMGNSVDLVHSTSFFVKSELEENEYDITSSLSSRESYEMGKQFVKPILFTTGDQIYPATLRYPRFEVVYSLLPNSLLVNDELQQYSHIQIAIILNMLYDVKNMDGYFLFMTATPPLLKESLRELISDDFILLDVKELLSIDYNDITKDSRDIVIYIDARDLVDNSDRLRLNLDDLRRAVDKSKPHMVKILEIKEDKEEHNELTEMIRYITEYIGKNQNTKKILIILNTIKRAQDFYDIIMKEKRNNEKLKNAEIILLHARYTLGDRTEKQRLLLSKIPNRKHIHESSKDDLIIAITTQIAEASLDIDADVLFTEIAPLESLFQRMGRVQRGNVFSDYRAENPNVFIFCRKEENDKSWYKPYKLETMQNIIEFLYQKKDYNIESKPLGFREKVELAEEFMKSQTEKGYYNMFKSQIKEMFDYISSGLGVINRDQAQRIFREVQQENVIPEELLYDLLQSIVEENINRGNLDTYEIIKTIRQFELPVPSYEIKQSSTYTMAELLDKIQTKYGSNQEIAEKLIQIFNKLQGDIKIVKKDILEYNKVLGGRLLPKNKNSLKQTDEFFI
ncbi:MAG: CRISPR-associated helicase Cas3' [Candidatus Micrarchaeota archaeon]|nr:CRISPR-associated helicase Cas3' [Candidatus Micrarchaeota archaeon]